MRGGEGYPIGQKRLNLKTNLTKMKIEITFKDPDALIDCVADGVRENFTLGDLSEEEAEKVLEVREETVRDICHKWFEHGEYLTVEVDTEKKTCTVLEVEEV